MVGPALALPSEDAYQPLPSRKLLVDAIQSMQDELIVRWSGTANFQGFPALAALWLSVRAAYMVRLAAEPEDRPSVQLRDAWATLDVRYGNPVSRSWWFTWQEANLRAEAVVDFLTSSGLLDLGKAEVDAPRHYLSDREVEGK